MVKLRSASTLKSPSFFLLSFFFFCSFFKKHVEHCSLRMCQCDTFDTSVPHPVPLYCVSCVSGADEPLGSRGLHCKMLTLTLSFCLVLPSCICLSPPPPLPPPPRPPPSPSSPPSPLCLCSSGYSLLHVTREDT